MTWPLSVDYLGALRALRVNFGLLVVMACFQCDRVSMTATVVCCHWLIDDNSLFSSVTLSSFSAYLLCDAGSKDEMACSLIMLLSICALPQCIGLRGRQSACLSGTVQCCVSFVGLFCPCTVLWSHFQNGSPVCSLAKVGRVE